MPSCRLSSWLPCARGDLAHRGDLLGQHRHARQQHPVPAQPPRRLVEQRHRPVGVRPGPPVQERPEPPAPLRILELVVTAGIPSRISQAWSCAVCRRSAYRFTTDGSSISSCTARCSTTGHCTSSGSRRLARGHAPTVKQDIQTGTGRVRPPPHPNNTNSPGRAAGGTGRAPPAGGRPAGAVPCHGTLTVRDWTLTNARFVSLKADRRRLRQARPGLHPGGDAVTRPPRYGKMARD